MRTLRAFIAVTCAALSILILPTLSFAAAPIVSVFASASGVVDPMGTAVKGPDSISFFNGAFWVVYTNGASKTCGGGNSTVVQYDTGGNVLQTFSIPNYVDGLRGNPADGKIWALQCEDGNSTVTVIDPVMHTLGTPMTYAMPSDSQGYDDAVFSGGSIFFSHTNPANTGDPLIEQLVPSSNPLTFGATLLAFGAMGKNLVTGQMQAIPGNDPDSLVLTPAGSLMLTSGDDGALIFVGNPGGTNTVSFLQLLDPATGVALASPAGLDDAVFATAAAGTFYVSDTGNNQILAIHVTGLIPGSLFASVGSLNEFAMVDMGTGKLTPLATGMNAPHGAAFVADPPGGIPMTVTTSVFATASGVADPSGATVKAPDSISIFNGSIWMVYTNGASKTCSGGNSTIVQYSLDDDPLQIYSVPNYVDGLRGNPIDGKIWALQCEDGNSTVTVIDPATHALSAPLTYAVLSNSQGYDDAVFSGGSIFFSHTNPANAGDPLIEQLVPGSNPLAFSATLLAFGATGTNLATGEVQPIPGNDPDSLILTPNGSLMLTSGDDGALIFVGNPGGANTVSFLQLLDPSTGAPLASPAGLDDGVFATAAAGTFYVSDTGNNQILAIHVTGLIPGSLFASVGSLNEFAMVDVGTGKLTPLVTAMNAPHGATFLPDPPGNVIEFYNAALDHYFITINPAEINALDTGATSGWVRTGQSFKAFAVNTPGTYPVCRFLVPPAHGNSHFLSASPSECAAVLQNYPFIEETPNAFYIALPDLATGQCQTGTIPVYRLWNQRADANHRYTTNAVIKAQMIAKGYVAEGYGPNFVDMCAQQ
jgi:DNA-binding beta-propeller fold protein YncE